jgi:hypothetical protein
MTMTNRTPTGTGTGHYMAFVPSVPGEGGDRGDKCPDCPGCPGQESGLSGGDDGNGFPVIDRIDGPHYGG